MDFTSGTACFGARLWFTHGEIHMPLMPGSINVALPSPEVSTILMKSQHQRHERAGAVVISVLPYTRQRWWQCDSSGVSGSPHQRPIPEDRHLSYLS